MTKEDSIMKLCWYLNYCIIISAICSFGKVFLTNQHKFFFRDMFISKQQISIKLMEKLCPIYICCLMTVNKSQIQPLAFFKKI